LYNPNALSSVKEYGKTFKPIQTSMGLLYQVKLDSTKTFLHLPSQVAQYDVDPQLVSLFGAGMVILTFENLTEDFEASSFVAQYLSQDAQEKEQQMGFATTTQTTFALPVITCANASGIPLVTYVLANETKGVMENGCGYIYTTGGQETIAITEHIRYKLGGITFEEALS
jgi:hypothetical protein